jgi:SAM-dependent methyltransferase
LDHVVPWGRSFDEYCRMFALGDEDLALRILGCGDGPASFNAEATRRRSTVISCDPIYKWQAADIRARIAATRDTILEQARQNADAYVWDSIRSVDELDRIRMAAMEAFLDDYTHGKADGRYVEGELPTLPFADRSFDLALCSHLLFLYSDQLGEAFHQHATRELCRVAREVRIFPLLALNWTRSPFVDNTMADLRNAGHEVSIEHVPYEFQRGANQMMRIRSRMPTRSGARVTT